MLARRVTVCLLFWAGFVLTCTADVFAYQISPPCTPGASLNVFVACVLDAMPGAETEGFVRPDPALEPAWQATVADMQSGRCNDDTLPVSLKDAGYALTRLPSDSTSYCILYEVADANGDTKVDRGWGTFIVNQHPSRLVDIQIPHPLNDAHTGTQGIGLFEKTGARSFSMAGAHRRANAAASTCQPAFREADAAHNVHIPFHWTATAMQMADAANGNAVPALQFHGMAASTCAGVDVYLTQGASTLVEDPAGILLALKGALQDRLPRWLVTVPGDTPSCGLSGTTNVQGRLMNGVPADQVCTVPASLDSVTGQFIHIEQKIDFRDPLDWEAVLEDTFPAAQQVSVEWAGDFVDGRLQEVSGVVYPNPFASRATILIETRRAQPVTLTLYDTLGRLRRIVFEGWLPAEQPLRISFDQADLPPGFYLLRIAGERYHHLLPLLAR